MADDLWERNAARVAEALNLLTVLAAPRLYARWCTQASPEELRVTLQSRMAALSAFCATAQGSPDADRFRAAAPKVQTLTESLEGAPPGILMDLGWNAQARECLAALGVPAPPEGWESFEGWRVGSS